VPPCRAGMRDCMRPEAALCGWLCRIRAQVVSLVALASRVTVGTKTRSDYAIGQSLVTWRLLALACHGSILAFRGLAMTLVAGYGKRGPKFS
jgi:hypothetical protein